MKNKKSAYFGKFGGMFVPEILVPPLLELEAEFLKASLDPVFLREYYSLLHSYAGRPTALYLCRNFSANKNVKIYLKREDLLHGGAHKTNQVIGQGLLAKRMNKTEIVAETGAGQHGVAAALISALLKLECRVFMGAEDIRRQELNVFRMKLLGAKVISVNAGSGTLKYAVNEALRYWSANYGKAHYMLGTAAGPHPYPLMVREFQKLIGEEARKQFLSYENKLPNKVIACVGGGSNAIGMFHAFINDKEVELIGVEPGGHGIDTKKHGAPLSKNLYGILHGTYSAVMQDDQGQILDSYSLSAGLDYPAVGPEHAYLKSIGRAQYLSVNDEAAVEAFLRLSSTEGIIPALESAHALAYAYSLSKAATEPQNIIVNLSGRGDKDLNIINSFLIQRQKKQ